MGNITERFRRRTFPPFLIERPIVQYYVGHIGVMGAHGVGKNTLCERFGRMCEGRIEAVEHKAYRKWRIDLYKRPLVGKIGTVLLCLHILFFREDAKKRHYKKILPKLNGIIFMFDITEPNTLHETIELVADFVSDYYGSDRPPLVLVGNKMDQRTLQPTPSHFPPEQGEIASLRINANAYFDCSAKCNAFCGVLLDYLLRMITGDRRRR
ncbi:hypothetical protein TNCV_4809081 [Trichonephila clavipes]|nr:hypothetical protein TNCV_4809081 [Trichonephila clavipes]